MESHRRLKLLLSLLAPFLFLIILFALYFYFRTKRVRVRMQKSLETGGFGFGYGADEAEEGLIGFEGGEELTAEEILEAPGEVVGKSSYGTLYRAGFARSGSVMLLRFVRPACVGRAEEVGPLARVIGAVRHPNLVPLTAMYVGPRGEKLFVHPFYDGGSLAQFLKDGKAESHRWEIIYKLSLGIARGLDHLHNGLHKPLIHGNLKSKNVLIDSDHQPRLSDFGLHLLMSPTSSQEMLEASASQGYKAPELIKMRDASKESDVYSLGVVFLEILTRKEPKSLRVPASLQNMFAEHQINESFSSKKSSCSIEESLIKFLHLAMACCSPSPNLRPDVKQIIKRLEELSCETKMSMDEDKDKDNIQ